MSTDVFEELQWRGLVSEYTEGLREVLAQSGIQLGQANVNEGSTQQQAQNENSGRRSAASRFASPAELSQVPVGSTSGSWTGRGSGAIDTFA